MGWNLKQQAQAHIVKVSIALLTLLLLVIWRAVPSTVWDRVSAVVPKPVLWALVALELIGIVGLVVALIDHRRKARRRARLVLCWGIYWDKSFNPYCGHDKTPLSFKSHALESGKAGTILYCPACKSDTPIWDSIQGALTLAEAKQQLRSRVLKKINSESQIRTLPTSSKLLPFYYASLNTSGSIRRGFIFRRSHMVRGYLEAYRRIAS